jgi:hypothetical protein
VKRLFVGFVVAAIAVIVVFIATSGSSQQHMRTQPIRLMGCNTGPLVEACGIAGYAPALGVRILDLGLNQLTNNSSAPVHIQAWSARARGVDVINVYVPSRNGVLGTIGGIVDFPLVRTGSQRWSLNRGVIVPPGKRFSVILTISLSPRATAGAINGYWLRYSTLKRRYLVFYKMGFWACRSNSVAMSSACRAAKAFSK